MCKYEMDLASIMQDTKQTWFCPQTDGQMNRRMDGLLETSIPPFQLRWSGRYKNNNMLDWWNITYEKNPMQSWLDCPYTGPM